MNYKASKWSFGLTVTAVALVLLAISACGKGLGPKENGASDMLDKMGLSRSVTDLPESDNDLDNFKYSFDWLVRDGITHLRWEYYNRGDYRQDGQVGIEDVASVAEHYWHKKYGGIWHPIDEVIDGSYDGIVSSEDGDIDPPDEHDGEIIGLNQNPPRTIHRYSIQYSDDQVNWTEAYSKP